MPYTQETLNDLKELELALQNSEARIAVRKKGQIQCEMLCKQETLNDLKELELALQNSGSSSTVRNKGQLRS